MIEKEAEVSIAVRNCLAGMRSDMIETLKRLVSIPSVTGTEGPAQEFMSAQYEALGLKVHRVFVDRSVLSGHSAFCDGGQSYDGRPNIIGILEGDRAKNSIILNGHVDTVPTGPLDQWTHHPYSPVVQDGRLYGRGAADMKGGLIAAIFAIKALLRLGIKPGGTVMLQSVIEEEEGGAGALACFLSGFTADGMIVTEPVPWVTVALAGILRCHVKVVGKAAHPSDSHKGVNAISKMIPIFRALEDLDARRKSQVRFPLFQSFDGSGPACHLIIGTFHAGDHIATVPAEAQIGCRIGFVPGETRDEIRNLILETIDRATADDPWLREHPPQVEWLPFQADPFHQDAAHPFVETVMAAARQACEPGSEVRQRGGTWSEDTRFAQYFGFPALSLGPTGGRAHGADEWVDLASIERLAQALAISVMDWCSKPARAARA